MRQHLESYLRQHWKEPELQQDVQALRELSLKDEEGKVKGVVPILSESEDVEKILDSVTKNVIWQMDQDRKTTALKQLQGHMWRHGYHAGELQGLYVPHSCLYSPKS